MFRISGQLPPAVRCGLNPGQGVEALSYLSERSGRLSTINVQQEREVKLKTREGDTAGRDTGERTNFT